MLCILRHSRKKTQKEAAEAEYALGKEPKGKRTKAKERLLSPLHWKQRRGIGAKSSDKNL